MLTNVFLDNSHCTNHLRCSLPFLCKIQASAADQFDQVLQLEEAARKGVGNPPHGGAGGGVTTGAGSVAPGAPDPSMGGNAAGSVKGAKKKTFFGTVELNPLQPKPQFGDVVDEIILLLNRPDVRLKISVEIQAESEIGFDDGIQRAVRENCNQLKVRGDFED